jgi:hypothetical protein
MASGRWTKTRSWDDYFRRGGYDDEGSASPFADSVFGPAPVFLFVSTTSPLPCAAYAGLWHAHPDAQAAALHLRHGILPSLFGTWLCRDAFDEGDGAIGCEELFQKAIDAEIEYAADVPLMRRIVARVDRALARKRGAYEEVAGACRSLTRRWRRTSSWDFEVVAFDDLLKVARHVARYAEGLDMGRAEWLEVAERAAQGNVRMQRRFRQTLQACVAI